MSPSVQQQPMTELLAGMADAPSTLNIAGLALDSREVMPGFLFLACRGHRQHGLQHVDEAITRGAAAVAWEPAPEIDPPELSVPAVAVDQLSARVGEIASRFWRRPSAQLRTVGITGTDGKTSTAHLLAQVWTALGTPCIYLGTLGYGSLDALEVAVNTTPDAVRLQRCLAAAVAAGQRACAMEVSSHALAQGRIVGTRFAAALLTNVGRDHLDYHGNLERYAAAKRSLFEREDTDAVLLNRDDAHGAEWAAQLASRHRLMVYGLGGVRPATSYVIGESLTLHPRGLRLDLTSTQGNGRIDSPLLGRFNAYNLLAVATVLIEAGVPVADVCSALGQARTVPGRAEAFRGPGAEPLVVVDYAHTPQALTQVLQALRPHATGKLICVFGCGGDRDRGKRPLMGAAAAQFADASVITDDNPRSEDPRRIAAEIRAGMPRSAHVEIVHDRPQAIRSAVMAAGADDVVLVAGKGHEDYQLYGDEQRAFSDREFVVGLLAVEPVS